MNSRKICFICCVDDLMEYQECLLYIRSLDIPVDFEVEHLAVESADSMTAGYNYAMRASDAKYKVYLHQDVRIINKQFIRDILEIFSHHPELGLAGVVGAAKLPDGGVWRESRELYGKVHESYTGKMEHLAFKEVEGDYQSVEAVDGFILFTQYDLPWREDLFQGWHFYDLSQCAEFSQAGYDVGIVRQETPWCIHDCGVVKVNNGFDYYRHLFLQTYADTLAVRKWNFAQLPLVSVLIPAYNRPKLLESALYSVLNQTYPNLEIIICDDSTNDEVQKMIAPYLERYPQIRYYKNERNLSAENPHKCIELSSGEFISFLCDDDLYHREKIEKMIRYFLQDSDVTLVTSYRELIDLNDKILPPIPATKLLFEQDTRINGIEFGNFLLKNTINAIGEPTTAMFRKTDLLEKFGIYKGRQYNINDMAAWIALLAKGYVVYISEALSYFRQHPNQNQRAIPRISGITEWLYLIEASREDGFLASETDYRITKNNLLKQYTQCIDQSLQSENEEDFTDTELRWAMLRCVDDITTPIMKSGEE